MPPVSAALVVIQPASKPATPTDLLAGNIFSVDSEFPSAHRTAVWNWPLLQRGTRHSSSAIVVQCDQTSFLATSMILLSEEERRPLQGPVQLPLTSEVQHGNRIDYSRSAVLTRWRRVGILSLARLAQIAG